MEEFSKGSVVLRNGRGRFPLPLHCIARLRVGRPMFFWLSALSFQSLPLNFQKNDEAKVYLGLLTPRASRHLKYTFDLPMGGARRPQAVLTVGILKFATAEHDKCSLELLFNPEDRSLFYPLDANCRSLHFILYSHTTDAHRNIFHEFKNTVFEFDVCLRE